MKNLILFFVLILISTKSFTYEDSDHCYTTGDCQANNPVYSPGGCYKVKTGIDNQGNMTCAIRFAPAILGYECKKIPGKLIGTCELEKQPTCNFDVKTCEDALDPN